MKNSISKLRFALAISSILILLSSFNMKKESCDRQKLLEQAIPKLKKFTIIQDYPFKFKQKKKSGDIEYKKQIITLNRGIRYKFFAIRNTDYEGVPVVSIFNNEKQEFLLGSTYNTNVKKFYEEIEFECKTTGNYCLSFSFFEGQEGCGLGVFSSNVVD